MSHVQQKIQLRFYVIHSYMHAFTFSVEKQYTNAVAGSRVAIHDGRLLLYTQINSIF